MLNDYINKNYKKVIGWGTSSYYKKVSRKLNINIDYLIDSNLEKKDEIIDALIVCTPGELMNECPDDTLVIIFSSYYEDIYQQVMTYGDFHVISGGELHTFGNLYGVSRERIIEINEMNKEVIITISRNNFSLYIGGTSKFIGEQMKLFNKNGYINIHLFWKEYNIKEYKGIFITIVKDGKEIGLYRLKDFLNQLQKIKAIIIHNLICMDFKTLEFLLDKLDNSIPKFYYIHDFSSVCTNIKLMFNNETFCSGYQNSWINCSSCISNQKKEEIYNFHKYLFSNYNIKLIAPSLNTKNIICTCFKIRCDQIIVIPHQTYNLDKKDIDIVNERIRIAYVGYKHVHKGWEQFKQLVKDYNGIYDFYCLGSSDEIIEHVKFVDVSFLEDGDIAMTKKLIEYNIDVSFLWSVWPETYSYTYYESYAAGTFIITNLLSGNIADQVRKNRNGIVLGNYDELSVLISDEARLRQLLLEDDTIIKNLKNNEKDILKLIETNIKMEDYK